MISDSLFRRFYPDQSRDGAVAFCSWVRESTSPETILLNLGAGPPADRGVRNLHGEVAKVVGADPDPEVLNNRDVDEAYVISTDGPLPFEDNSFELVLSDWVVEHVVSPARFLAEVRRVLKPGGSFFLRTPSQRHYVALVARMTPHWCHELIAIWARGYPPGANDPWPTVYRLNSRRTIESGAYKAGFRTVEIRMWEYDPKYLLFHPIPFVLGAGYERIVNRYEVLSGLRPTYARRDPKRARRLLENLAHRLEPAIQVQRLPCARAWKKRSP
jgi:ubiquinone/menaquinone biosynthesis C-methylase UbiE